MPSNNRASNRVYALTVWNPLTPNRPPPAGSFGNYPPAVQQLAFLQPPTLSTCSNQPPTPLPLQAVLVIILLVYNRTLCHRSAALVHAYESIKRVVGRRLWALVPQSVLQWAGEALRALLSSGGAAGAAGAAAAGAASCGSGGACTALDWVAECLGLGPGGASSGACPLVSGEALCLLAQPFTQLAVGFLLPTLFVYARELRDRRAFARCVWGGLWVCRCVCGGG